MFPGLLFPFLLAFPAQIAWTDLTPGSFPMHFGWGTHSLYTWGRTAGIEHPMDSSVMGWLLFPCVTYSIWRSQVGKSQQLWLDSSFPYLVGTNPTTTQGSSYLQDLEKTRFFSYHPVFIFCRLAGYEFVLWWSRWLTLSSHLFMISWHLVLSFVFMVRCLFFPVSDRNPNSFLKISIYPLKNLTGETFSLIFLVNSELSLAEKLQYFITF